MSAVRTAIHLRTGESRAAERIDAWLRQHGVETAEFSDAYELCVHLLQHSAEIPDLAFVGADWLSSGEFAIVRYLRETWPGVGIIVYSSAGETPPCQPGPLTCVCRSAAVLQRVLAESPERTLGRLREEARAETPQPTAGEDQARPNARPLRRNGQTGKSKLPPAADQPPRSILTDEELSALLDEEGT